MIKVEYTPAARDQLGRILRDIAAVSPVGSRNVGRRIRGVVRRLRTHGDIGRQTDDSRIRRINANPYPYVIFYEHRKSVIVIHAVIHGARDPETMPGATPDRPTDT